MAYGGAAAISTLNDAMADRIHAKGIAREKVSVVPHGVDPDLFDLRETACPARFRRAHGFDGGFLVVHAGNMGVKQGLDVILDAAAMSRDCPEIIYLLVGDGAARSALQRRVEEQKLSNVRFLPPLPCREFHDLLVAADLAVVTQRRAVADILFPSKVETLMAAGRPILASLNAKSAVARVLRESGAGEVVEPESPRALLGAILALRHEQSRMDAMGQRGQAYAREHWERARGLELMESKLRRVCLEAKETVAGQVIAAEGSARAAPDADWD
jgi:colanic acid biosynthesis glycosyl transferase WcaI